MCGNGAGTGIAVVRLQAGRIRLVLLPVITASFAAAAGSTVQSAPLVRLGTTAIPTSAASILACGWSRVPDEKCTSVSYPTKYIRIFCWASSFLLKQKTSLLCGTTDIRVRIDGEFRLRLKRRFYMEPAASVASSKIDLHVNF